MSETEQLQRFARFTVELTRELGISEAARREERIKSVYGNLGYERPELTIEDVRRVFGEDRAERSSSAPSH